MNTLVSIQTCGQPDYCRRAVQTALAHLPPGASLLVVDEGCPDVAWAEEFRADPRFLWERWPENRGYVQAVNQSCQVAVDRGCDVVVWANSDIVFPAGWLWPLQAALQGPEAVLSGPWTNAPGHQPRQNVRRLLPEYQPDDREEAVTRTASLVQALGDFQQEEDLPYLNGFLMAARVDFLIRNRFNATHYFDPQKVLAGLEHEWQGRARQLNPYCRFVLARRSFVFHYKDVSAQRYNGTDPYEYRRPL